MDKYDQLNRRIEELEKKLSSLENSSTIPYGVEKSLVGRRFLKAGGSPIYLVGADQGSWLNTGGGSAMAFPSAFIPLSEGDFTGLWIPLYIPPSQVTPGH